PRDACYEHIGSSRDVRRDVHVVDAQEVKTRDEASRDATENVAGIEQPQLRAAARRGVDPPRDDRQRRAHRKRWRQQARRRDECPDDHSDRTLTSPRRVKALDEWHGGKKRESAATNRKF